MKLRVQKRLASSILKRSKKKIRIDTSKLEDVKEAITRFDIRSLVKDKTIKPKPVKGTSKVRSRKLKLQKSKGRRSGPGSRKGKSTARLPKKDAWMARIRKQRDFLKELKEKKHLDSASYRNLYNKAKGGFFRSKRHIKIYMEEHKLVKK